MFKKTENSALGLTYSEDVITRVLGNSWIDAKYRPQNVVQFRGLVESAIEKREKELSLVAAKEESLQNKPPLDAGHFYNLTMHALSDYGASHHGCRERLKEMATELLAIMQENRNSNTISNNASAKDTLDSGPSKTPRLG